MCVRVCVHVCVCVCIAFNEYICMHYKYISSS